MKFKRYDILLALALLALAAVAILLSSCNPVKRVMKDQRKVEQVVLEWRKKNPVDTTQIKYIRGKDTTIFHERIVHDSIPLPYTVNHRFREIHYRDRIIVDTLKVTVRDVKIEQALQNSLDEALKDLDILDFKLSEKLQKMTDNRNFWRRWAWIGWIIIAAAVFLYLNKRFQIIPKLVGLVSPIKLPFK